MAAALSTVTPGRSTWVEIDLDALSGNFAAIRRRIGPSCKVLAVVKANAYGHGAVPVARRLQDDGADMLGVALVEEAAELRDAGITLPILVMGALERGQIPALAEYSLTPMVFSLGYLEALLAEARRRDRTIALHLKVDTGMGRLGLLERELPSALAMLESAGSLVSLEGMLTHLSCAEDPADEHTLRQLGLFNSLVQQVRDSGFQPRLLHAANSGGLINHPASWFNMVRPGISLYGVPPSGVCDPMELRPMLSFRSKLLLVKSVAAGTPLGYGRTFVTSRESVIATVPAGYADGVTRLLSNRGTMLVRGCRAPYAGSISMDHCMIDITGVSGAQEGDPAVLIGSQEGEQIGVAEFASWAETIPYEILCQIGRRVPRVYLQKIEGGLE